MSNPLDNLLEELRVAKQNRAAALKALLAADQVMRTLEEMVVAELLPRVRDLQVPEGQSLNRTLKTLCPEADRRVLDRLFHEVAARRPR